MALTRVAPAGIGSTPGTGYVIGDSFLHSRGLNATDGYYTGIVTTQSLRVIGDLEVEGTTTTLDTALTEVDKLEVGANNSTVGLAVTQSGNGANSRFTGGYVDIDTAVDSALNLNATDDGPIYSSFKRSGTRIGYYGFGGSGNTFNVVNEATGGQFNINTPSDFSITTNSAEKLRVKSDGKVGIGTNNPRTNFQVGAFGSGSDSNIQLATGTSGASNILFGDGSGGTDWYKGFIKYNHSTDNLELYSTDDIIHYTNGSERLRITSNGKVGVGSDNPGQTLSIAGSSAGLGIYNTGNNHGNVYFYKDGTPKGWLKYRGDNDTLLIGNVTDSIHVATDGDVAIGGATPVDRLTVYHSNNGNATGITIRNTESSSTYSHARLRLESQNGAAYAHLWADVANSALRLGYNSSSTVNIDNVGRLFVGGNGTVASSSERLTVRGMAMVKNDSTTVAPLYLQNANFTANTNQPYITLQDGSGNRGGIGIENNTSGMWLSGQNAIIFRGGTSSPGNAEWGRFNTDAHGGTFNVGPDTVGGSPTAAARVNIYGNNQTQGTMRIEPHSDKGTNVSHIHHGSNGNWYIRSANNSGQVIIQDNGGNTSVGHTSPDSRFHVKSTSNHVATFEYSSTSDMAIRLKNSQGSMYFGLGGGEEFAVSTDEDLNGSGMRFSVDSNGIVRAPDQPSFYVSGSFSLTSWNSVKHAAFGSAVFDNNNDYSGGVFTAPVDGKYYFSASFLTGSSAGFLLWTFYKNTTKYPSGWFQTYDDSIDSNNECQLTGSVIIDMSAGDTARTAIHSSHANVYTTSYNYFLGYLIG